MKVKENEITYPIIIDKKIWLEFKSTIPRTVSLKEELAKVLIQELQRRKQ